MRVEGAPLAAKHTLTPAPLATTVGIGTVKDPWAVAENSEDMG